MNESIKYIQVIPAILEASFADVEKRFAKVSGLVPMVQVDICDGKFVPSRTVGYDGRVESFDKLSTLASEHSLQIELDMMVRLDDNLNRWLTNIKASGAKRAVLHFGSTNNWSDVFAIIGESEAKIGLAIHIDTSLLDVYELLDNYDFDLVQVMGIAKVGYGGQSFDKKALNIVRSIKAKYPDMLISADGGVNIDTASSLVRAGVNNLVAGSAIFKSGNPQQAIDKLKQIV